MNPDFKIKGQAKVIELFGDYWHKNENPQARINDWKSVGIQCLVVWEADVRKDMKEVLTRVEAFV